MIYILLFITKIFQHCVYYDRQYACMNTSISTGLYPTLDLWNINKLHYITSQKQRMCNPR
jgi:hypothetical protein